MLHGKQGFTRLKLVLSIRRYCQYVAFIVGRDDSENAKKGEARCLKYFM